MNTVPHVHVAVAAVKKILAEHGGITKDKQANYGERYNFRGIDDMYNVLCGVTAAQGLNMYPVLQPEYTRIDYQTNDKNRLQTYLHIVVAVDLVSAIDGSFQRCIVIGGAIDAGDKATGKAMSYAMKNACIHAFQIPASGESMDVESYETQTGAPAAEQKTPLKGPGIAKARQRAIDKTTGKTVPVEAANGVPTAAVGEVVQLPAATPPPFPDGTEAAPPSSDVGGLIATIRDVNTFPVLYASAVEADKYQGPGRDQLFDAIRSRAIYLFSSVKKQSDAQEGIPLVKALGSPEELRRACNEAYARLRVGAGGNGSAA